MVQHAVKTSILSLYNSAGLDSIIIYNLRIMQSDLGETNHFVVSTSNVIYTRKQTNKNKRAFGVAPRYKKPHTKQNKQRNAHPHPNPIPFLNFYMLMSFTSLIIHSKEYHIHLLPLIYIYCSKTPISFQHNFILGYIVYVTYTDIDHMEHMLFLCNEVNMQQFKR